MNESDEADEPDETDERDESSDDADTESGLAGWLRIVGPILLVLVLVLYAVSRGGGTNDATDDGTTRPVGVVPRLRVRIRRIPRGTMLATIATVRAIGRLETTLRRAGQGLGRGFVDGMKSIGSSIRWPSLSITGLFHPGRWLSWLRPSDRSGRSTKSAGRTHRRTRPADTAIEDASSRPAEPASVEGAWDRFVAELPLRRRSVRTPRECAAVAVDRGLPEDAVETLTESFERVRYGPTSASSEELDRARAAYATIRGATGGDRS